MRVSVLNRACVALGIGAVALLGLGVAANAQGQRDQGQRDRGRQEDQKDAGQGRGRGRGQQELQQQKRKAQYAFQQDYVSRLREQHSRLQSRDRYDYDRDPFFYTLTGTAMPIRMPTTAMAAAISTAPYPMEGSPFSPASSRESSSTRRFVRRDAADLHQRVVTV